MEIDFIVDHKIENNEMLYYVLPKNSSFENQGAWISESELKSYQNMVHFYKSVHNPPELLNTDLLFAFAGDLVRKPNDILTVIKLCSLVYRVEEKVLWSLNLPFKKLVKKVAPVLLNMPLDKLNKRRKEFFSLMKFSLRRKLSLRILKQWEIDINTKSACFISVENNVDTDGPPKPFQFINDYLSFSVDIDYDPILFCTCKNCNKYSDKCCPHNYDIGFPYDKNGHLQLLPGYPIYECNKKCQCDDSCRNRVVQHGPKVKLAVFKTSDNRGWGLKSLESIQSGVFVIEYLGEIITSDEAEERGNFYDTQGITYLFDLDYEEESIYTVDGYYYANAARFINHSCDPNLQVFSVFINQVDPRLPRLGLFSKRRINVGEELTIDYKMINKTRDDSGQLTYNENSYSVVCKCNSKNCRKYLC